MKKKENLYKITIKKKNEKAQEYIYGAENNFDIVHKFLHTMDDVIGEKMDEVEFFKWEIETNESNNVFN